MTHVDLDGVGCAVLALLAFGADVEVQYCKNPTDCTERLVKLADDGSWKKYDRIIVSDTSFKKVDLVGKTKNDAFFSKVRVFDHHDTAKNNCGGEKWATITEYKDGRLTCGTELLHDYLVFKGLVQPRPYFVELVRLYDTWDWTKKESKLPYYLSTLVFALGFSYFTETYTKRLAKRDVDELSLFNQYERDILAFRMKQIESETERFLKATRKVVTSRGTFGFVFVSEGADVSDLGHRICTEHGVDAAFMLYPNTGKVSVRTDREDFNVGEMLFEVVGGTAGGHPKSGGCVFDESVVKNLIRLALDSFGDVEV